MTRQQQIKAKCPKCGEDVETRTEFSRWVNALPYPHNSSVYDCQNLDFIWFHYREGWLITLEEKRYGAQSQKAQQDTHQIVAQLLAQSSGQSVNTLRGNRPIVYRGHYTVIFEKTTPDDSAWVSINGTKHDNPKQAVLDLLTDGRVGDAKVLSLDATAPDLAADKVWKWIETLPTERLWKLFHKLVNVLEERALRKTA